jgi:hypothetical protein
VQETFLADMLSESLCQTIGVVRISKTDGASKLLERVDALPRLPEAWPVNENVRQRTHFFRLRFLPARVYMLVVPNTRDRASAPK